MSYKKFSSIIQSLVTNSGEMGEKSCLNWGQRDARERDEAYIRLSVEHQNSGFFPKTGVSFKLLTSDGKQFTCIREQSNGKAITTVGDKSLLGIYFRDKLNLPHDALVTTQDLDRYGRRDVTFYKITHNEDGEKITPYYMLEF